VTAGLVVVVVVLAILSAVNLVFTVAVVRRLRQQGEQLAELSNLYFPDSGLPPGSAVPQVLTGGGVAATDVSLIAFTSATCEPCRLHLPEFIEVARQRSSGDVVVVVSGDAAKGADLVDMVGDAARVVVEPEDGPWVTAFEVRTFPTFYRLGDAVIDARCHEVAELTPTVPV
jgi:hypothetical protein